MSNTVIWADMEAYNGRGYRDPDAPVELKVEGPENKRECPCDTCPMMDACLANATECSAMRNWCSKGDFADKDLMRLVRGCA
jgi:hypothetical protein